jgi:hypothetical protein
MKYFYLKDLFTSNQLLELQEWLSRCKWNSKIPGGFVTNSPKRLVNTYGNGCKVNSQGELYGDSWTETHWTPKMSQNNMTLTTPTKPLPLELSRLIPIFRECFLKTFPNAILTDNTFSIAVCNYYTDPDMYIAAHRDDNVWYPHENGNEPVFASFTYYPDKKPERDEDYARFQIRDESLGKWLDIKLEHESIMIMSSAIEHRVKPFNTKRGRFYPRINITFRSTYPIEVNPLMHLMAVSNHNRYYRMPSRIQYPNDIDKEVVLDIINRYNIFLRTNNYPLLQENPLEYNKIERTFIKKKELVKYRQLGFDTFRATPNIVLETLQLVNRYLE